MNLLEQFILISDNAGLASAFAFFGSDSDFDHNIKLNTKILSQKEFEIYSKFTSAKRQTEFIAGRLACKKAFCKLTSKNEKNDSNFFDKFSLISVINSKTRAPFIENSDFHITISHSHGIAIASVSKYQSGIDIEKINPKKISALKKMSPKTDPNFQDIVSLTVLWTLKESLGKALQTGIVKDFKLYDTQNLHYENGIYLCDFKNFPSFHGIAITDNNYSIAIVVEKNIF